MERLLEFLEEALNRPPAAVEVRYTLGTPGKVVRQKNQLAQLSIDLHLCHHPTQNVRIGAGGGSAAQLDDLVGEDVAVRSRLEFARDAELQVVFGARDPEDVACRQVGQVLEVDVGLVEDDDFAWFNARAQLARPEAVVLAGGVDDGEARQEALQVEADVALGGGFAAPVLGPIHAPGDQLNGRGVDDVNGALEAEGEAWATTAAELSNERLKVIEDFPEEDLGQGGVALTIGMRKAVLARRSRSADGGKRTGSEPERIGDIVESQGMGQLREQQAEDVAPRAESAALLLDPMLARQTRDQVGRNEVAELVEHAEPVPGWLAGCGCFHTPTLWQGPVLQASLSFTHSGVWDGCVPTESLA